jgi:hypothetical protein
VVDANEASFEVTVTSPIAVFTEVTLAPCRSRRVARVVAEVPCSASTTYDVSPDVVPPDGAAPAVAATTAGIASAIAAAAASVRVLRIPGYSLRQGALRNALTMART